MESLRPLAAHPWLENRLVFTLPRELLRYLRDEIEIHQLDPELYDLEEKLSELAGDHSSVVGFWNGQPVCYSSLLQESSQSVSSLLSILPEEWKQQPGWKEIWDRKETIFGELERTLARTHDDSRGYVGWLLCNPQFVTEHDAFFTKWQAHVREYGLPQPGPPSQEAVETGVLQEVTEPDAETLRFCSDFREFLGRWRLMDLRAPYLPLPMGLQSPLLLPHGAFRLRRGGGQLFFLPDTAPVWDRDALRTAIESAMARDAQPSHLTPWMRIVGANNRAKGQVPRFGRLFQLHHFWGVLHARWGNHLRGRTEKLRYAFAAFLLPDGEAITTVESIAKDLRFLSRQRGSDWYRRPLNLF